MYTSSVYCIETETYELLHQDLRCLQPQLFPALVVSVSVCSHIVFLPAEISVAITYKGGSTKQYAIHCQHLRIAVRYTLKKFYWTPVIVMMKMCLSVLEV